MKENAYTISLFTVDLPQKETFDICKEVCNNLKQAKVEKIEDNKFFIKGKSKASIHSFVGHKFILLVEKTESGSNITIYYNYLGIGAKLTPAKADFIDPLFKELLKKMELREVATDAKMIHDYFLDNLTGEIKMDEIEQKFHCTMCSKQAAFLHFQSSSICNSCFEKKFGKIQLTITNAQYHGGHKAYLAGGYFSKFQLGMMFLTDDYLIFAKGDNDSTKRWEIIIPLKSVIIEKWGIEEESRRKDIVGGGVALGDSGVAIGGGSIHDSGKAHHVVVPYLDENGIPQDPRFGASSLGGKVIRELTGKLYELIVKAKKNQPSASNNSQTNYTIKDENPIQILKMRLAKGEITKEEYEDLKKVLE